MNNQSQVLDQLRGHPHASGSLSSQPSTSESRIKDTSLKEGDTVRVLTQKEIAATLGEAQILRGCRFTTEMWQYCGTVQQVLKPMEVYLDERDYRTKRASGIILLEGLLCRGTAFPDGCDRCCFLLWREEWLEKIG